MGLSNNHCCWTCVYAQEVRLNGNLEINCPLQMDGLQANLPKLVIVNSAERCDHYFCDEARFYAAHGFNPDEERTGGNSARPGILAPAW
jgi:hypothetical protein